MNDSAMLHALIAIRRSLAAIAVFAYTGAEPDFMPALSGANEADAEELRRAYSIAREMTLDHP